MSISKKANKLVLLDGRTNELKKDIMLVRELNVNTPDEYMAVQRLESLLVNTKHILCDAKKDFI
ncbi:MAG: hypothetical protein WCJ60_02260 [bacterium]